MSFTSDEEEDPCQTITSTVENRKAQFHNDFLRVCSKFNRRALQIRCDLGSRAMIFTATLPYIGCEFRAVPRVHIDSSAGLSAPLDCVRWGCDTNALVLYYKLTEVRFDKVVLDWTKVIVDFGQSVDPPLPGVDMLIERWFQVTPPAILSSEAEPLELDDAPVVTVQGILTSRAKGRGKISGLRGGCVTVTLYDNTLNVHFGMVMERFFGAKTVDEDLRCFVSSELSEGAELAPSGPNSDPLDAVIFGHEGTVQLHECSDFTICPKMEMPTLFSGCPSVFFTVGITWEEWTQRDEPLFGDYEPIDGISPDEGKGAGGVIPGSWEDFITSFKAQCLSSFACTALAGPVLVGV